MPPDRFIKKTRRRARLFALLALLAGCTTSVETQLETASLEMQQGAYEHAVEIYTEVLRKVPDAPRIHNNLGFALMQLGRYEESLPHFAAAAENQHGDHPDPALLHNWGTALEKLERFEEAAEKYAAAAEADPTSAPVQVGWGNALSHLEKYEEAVERYSEAVGLDPNSSVAWFNLGYTQEQLGRHDEAVISYQTFLSIGTEGPSNLHEHARNFVAQAQAAGRTGGLGL
ncbi:MAG: tetratricopeptide repeat protein [Nitrospirota bacterium]|nr:tetratricopeptide repeat protein [Nitrospirota bacterium]